MSKKGATIFGGALMSLIIGIVVVISIVVGVVLAWDNIGCYTGIKWLTTTPFGPSVGTVSNIKTPLNVEGPLVTNYTYCSETWCEDKYSEDEKLKQECIDSICAKDYPKKTTDYFYFEINVRNQGPVPTKVTVSALQDETEFWSQTTSKLEYNQEITITTPAADVVVGECELKFKADPSNMMPTAEYELSRADFGYCLNTQTIADKQANRGLREDCIADCKEDFDQDVSDCHTKHYPDIISMGTCISKVRDTEYVPCAKACGDKYP
jgi:hypothetical protein